MKKITSKQCPPGDMHIVLTMQRRNGEVLEYHTGSYRKESEMKRELKGCEFCVSIVGVNVNGQHRMSCSHPRFHRYSDYHCGKCKPKVARLSEIESEMAKLANEVQEILEYKKAR
jgi:hypothetical protein